MKKRFFALFLAVFIICIAQGAVCYCQTAERFTATAQINGENVKFYGYDINGEKCIRIWDLAGLLKNTVCMFDLSFDVTSGKLNLTPMCNYSGESFNVIPENKTAEYADEILYLNFNGNITEVPAHKIDGNGYVNMNAVADIMGYEVLWNEQTKSADITAGGIIIQNVKINSLEGAKCIALTFDDGPMTGSTEVILEALDSVGGHATFFVVGSMAAEHPELVKAIVEQGSQVGNHSYNHANLAAMSKAGIQSEVNRTSNKVYEASGVYTYIGRPPYGSVNSTVRDAVDIDWFNWNVDTLDWKYRDANYVYNYVMNNVKEGDVVLMHDLHPTTAQAMKRAIPDLAAKGYTFVTIDELAEIKGGRENLPGYIK